MTVGITTLQLFRFQHSQKQRLSRMEQTSPSSAPSQSAPQLSFSIPPPPIPPPPQSPFIVLGTAGSGTRVVHSLLESYGVAMSSSVNRQKDSLHFIRHMKMSRWFGRKNSSNSTLMEFIRQHQSVLYNLHSPYDSTAIHATNTFQTPVLPKHLTDNLIRQTQLLARSLALEFPFDLVKPWGFKEPQCMFVVPFLLHQFPNLHIIHVVRDGRDIAFSHQQHQPFQKFYAEFVVDEASSDIAVKVARLWQLSNVQLHEWGVRNPKHYTLIRLEDLCKEFSGCGNSCDGTDKVAVSMKSLGLYGSGGLQVNLSHCRLEKFKVFLLTAR